MKTTGQQICVKLPLKKQRGQRICVKLPWKHQVSKLQAIPGGMFQDPVLACAIIYEYHQNDADSAKKYKIGVIPLSG
jgi:hypothetical protein